MTSRMRLGLLCPLISLAACSHLTDQVRDSMNLATTLTQACTQPNVRNISSPESIADNLQSRALADFGFADRPINVPDNYRTSYSVQSALTSIHDILAAIEEQDKPGFADATAAAEKLRADARAIKGTLQSEFTKWKSNIKSTCGSGNNEAIACYVDFSVYVQTATAAVHDDYVTLDGDAQDLARKLKADIAKARSLDQSIKDALTQDATRLTRYVAIMLVLLDDIAQHESIRECSQCKLIFADVEESGKQYLAYEVANITMNQLDHIARTAESKLDEIDQKSWFILSAGDFLYSKAIADKVSATIIDALPKKTMVIDVDHTANMFSGNSFVDGRYLQDAITAYSCKRITADMSGSDPNAVRTETLLYPVYAGLICGFGERDGKGKPTNLCDSVTNRVVAPPLLMLAGASPNAVHQPQNLTDLLVMVDTKANQQVRAAGKPAEVQVNRVEIKKIINDSVH